MDILQDTALKRDLNTSFPWSPVILFSKPETHRNPYKIIETQQLGSPMSTLLSTLVDSNGPHTCPGFRGTPAGTSTKWQPVKHSPAWLLKNYPYCTDLYSTVQFHDFHVHLRIICMSTCYGFFMTCVYFVQPSLSPGSSVTGLLNGLVVLIKCVALHLGVFWRPGPFASRSTISKMSRKILVVSNSHVFKAKHLKILKPLVSGARFPSFPIQDTLHFMFKCDRSAATPSAGTMASVKSWPSCSEKHLCRRETKCHVQHPQIEVATYTQSSETLESPQWNPVWRSLFFG